MVTPKGERTYYKIWYILRKFSRHSVYASRSIPRVFVSRSSSTPETPIVNDPFVSAEKKGTTASDKSGKDDRRDSKNHFSGRLFHVPHLFLHPLQRHLVDQHQRQQSRRIPPLIVEGHVTRRGSISSRISIVEEKRRS